VSWQYRRVLVTPLIAAPGFSQGRNVEERAAQKSHASAPSSEFVRELHEIRRLLQPGMSVLLPSGGRRCAT